MYLWFQNITTEEVTTTVIIGCASSIPMCHSQITLARTEIVFPLIKSQHNTSVSLKLANK